MKNKLNLKVQNKYIDKLKVVIFSRMKITFHQ